MSARKRLRPSSTPKMMPSTTPITKPRMASSNVTAICSQSGPCAVPCVTHVTSCAKMPEGCPQKNESISVVGLGLVWASVTQRVPSSQPPMMTTINATRRTLTRMLRRRRAAEYDFTSLRSGAVVVCSLTSLLSALIANHHLLAKIFPDLLVQLHEPRIEADLLHLARTRQVNRIDALEDAWPRRQNTYPVGQGDGLLQVVGDEDHGGQVGGPQLEQFVFHQGPRLHVEGAERLVHQQDLRFVDKCLGQRHALAHAARELVRVAVLETGQSDTRNPLVRALERLGFWLAAEQRACGHVAQHIPPGENSIGLEDIANARVDALHGFAHHLHRPFTRPLQARDQPQGGGFAAAGRADHRTELARCDAESDVPYRGVDLTRRRS